MAHWLMKSEPNVFGWDNLKESGIAPWDDVRNYQARNNMKAMKKGELVFFYHSNIGREIVGIMEVVQEHYPDPLDERFVLVDMACKKKLKKPVTLAEIRSDPRLKNIALIKQSRLSVMPITDQEWDIICTLSDTIHT
ncbi:MAG: EVE domain-containing protein [Alphaproteobacteria bacterium]|jgi:predicted RNA-binding protein with PUA-like domain|nr:EVE domain-containing protein [Alphaproteobacteria bacterium]MCB1550687.1 EVE domain-containing protein [Alphaproteobacteria bacterium]MCB9985352.1 EVE domain-containing protein [Micavibrio sp.]HRK98132.1 EVE domain-containing protein [Alphaproteobacteria bacterium]